MMIGKSSSFDTEILELGEWRSVNTLAHIQTLEMEEQPGCVFRSCILHTALKPLNTDNFVHTPPYICIIISTQRSTISHRSHERFGTFNKWRVTQETIGFRGTRSMHNNIKCGLGGQDRCTTNWETAMHTSSSSSSCTLS